MKTPINDKLSQLNQEGRLPFHMPGHKRKADPQVGFTGKIEIRQSDITEITGFDDLHQPRGIIRQSMDQLKKVYGTEESWYLVNGSTLGILAAISAVCAPGDGIVIGRNCHRSVYNAIDLLHLSVSYLWPAKSTPYGFWLDLGEEQMGQLREILRKERNIKAVVLTSPTYEGVVTDIAAVRKLLSDIDDRIVLIVDEAHGAHLPFHDAFPESALACGADLVVQSVHKTLPALTQTALLHLCSARVKKEEIFYWLSVYETSSPSYILMASAESAVRFMHNRWKNKRKYVDNLSAFRRKCEQLLHIHLIKREEIPSYAYDQSKLLLSVKGRKDGGKWIFERLRDRWKIELEMAGWAYAIAMTSVMDSEEDNQRLFEALAGLDRELEEAGELPEEDNPQDLGDCLTCRKQEKGPESGDCLTCRKQEKVLESGDCLACRKPEKVLDSWQCRRMDKEWVPLSESTGKIAACRVTLYPPGVPVLVPGEKIIKEIVENISLYLYNGYNVQGLSQGGIHVISTMTDTGGGCNEGNICCDGGPGRIRQDDTD